MILEWVFAAWGASLCIYGDVTRGRVNRLNHVRSALARALPLTLTPFLLCIAPTACFHLSLCALHTCRRFLPQCPSLFLHFCPIIHHTLGSTKALYDSFSVWKYFPQRALNRCVAYWKLQREHAALCHIYAIVAQSVPQINRQHQTLGWHDSIQVCQLTVHAPAHMLSVCSYEGRAPPLSPPQPIPAAYK